MLPTNKKGWLLIGILLAGIIPVLVGWITQVFRKDQLNQHITMLLSNFRPYVLTKEAERALQPGTAFR